MIGKIESTVNRAIGIINGAINLINAIPGVSVGHISTVSLPRMAKGGVLKKGQIGLLEGSGAEAVVPLENNKAWISAVSRDMLRELQNRGMLGGSVNNIDRSNVNSFTQVINSPKQLSRIEIYRQTRRLLVLAKRSGGD